MHPWRPSDVNLDGQINVLDFIAVVGALGVRPGNPNWNPNADVQEDGVINVLDLITVAVQLSGEV